MILRDDSQAALDDVIVECETVAERYRDSAQRIDDEQWARLFAVRGAQLERLAEQLGADLRALDDLPSDPDPEREALHGLAERLRAVLAGGERAAVLSARRDDERTLLETIARARKQKLAPSVLAHLQRGAELARHMLAQLERLNRNQG
ncbi:MAG TPA: hypothetical protein ENO23_02855 [Alphaproteobacteria bacterium]|nr:hypothetical protein [Alphaproteobacteria bacterium]